MSAKHLLITEVTPAKGTAEALAASWANLAMPEEALQREVYIAQDGDTALEILALPDLHGVSNLSTFWQTSWNQLGPHLASDFARQILEFVEAPKDCVQPIPASPNLQLRHIEVPLSVYHEYRVWRDRTIFDVVRRAAEVDVFLAYHSLVSSTPGVMFVSGFSAALKDYTSVFTSNRYQQIVREAGTQFIAGGEKGLYTKIYRHLKA